jgi:hypothetical protein
MSRLEQANRRDHRRDKDPGSLANYQTSEGGRVDGRSVQSPRTPKGREEYNILSGSSASHTHPALPLVSNLDNVA